MKGAGYPECYATGYRGGIGIFEILALNQDI